MDRQTNINRYLDEQMGRKQMQIEEWLDRKMNRQIDMQIARYIDK